MSARARVVRMFVAIAGALGLMALWGGTAWAGLTHLYVGSFGSFSNVQGVAIDSSGDVYVYDGGAGTVFKFDASGSPVNFTSTGTNSIGVGSAGGDEGEIAVDDSSGPAKGDIYVAHADGTIEIYGASGSKLGELGFESGRPWGEACGVAVDSLGSVYVGLYSEHINKYTPSSNPVTNANYVSSLTGLNSVCNVAADSAGNVFADTWSSGPVTRYTPSQFGSVSASGSIVDGKGSSLAVDPASDEIYVDEQGQIAQFGAHGEPFEEPVTTFASSGSGAIAGSIGIAVSGTNHDIYASDGKGAISVFGAAVVVPDASTGEASNVQPAGATVAGTVNPGGAPVSECKFEYGITNSYGESAPCAESPAQIGSGSSPVEVHADLTGLSGGATYHYRLVAANSNGSGEGVDKTFSTPSAPVVSGEGFSEVGAGEATLSANIDPGNLPTTYHVEYGVSEPYGQRTAESGSIGSDGTAHAVTAHITGLAAGTTYHFRFVASNAVGSTSGADTVFSTFPTPSPAGNCPNEARRQEQDVAYLPDCRAYEMVSPLDKNGSNVIGDGRITDAAWGGGAVAYGAYAGFGETTGSGAAGITQYVAVRHEGEGWASHGITPTPAQEAFQFLAGATGTSVFSADLSKALTGGYSLPGAEGSGVPNGENLYIEDLSTGALQTISTPLGSETPSEFAVLGAQRGSSRDLGVVTFETSANFLPEAEGFANKLYAWEHGTLKLAGVLPDGSFPANGSEAAHPGAFNALANEGSISSDGSHILFRATPNGGSQRQLYMRKDGTSTAWVSQPEMAGAVSEPKEVAFDKMTPDARHVLFVTKDRLSQADPGTEGYGLYGLYMYTDGPQPESEENLTFLGRLKVKFQGYFEEEEAVLGISDDGGRVYFFTEKDAEFPESGIYLWEEGKARLVVPVEELSDTQEPQLSDDGQTLAFVATKQLTGAPVQQDVSGRTPPEMYVYQAGSNTLTCASCLVTGGVTASGVEIDPKATKSAIATFNGQFKTRFVTTNGRRVFFTTATRLVTNDANGKPDVYEYDVDTGKVALLSTGTGESGAWLAAAGIEGNDVFILTGQQLLASDTDTLVDLYDVRVNGGFPQPPVDTGGCVGDECQGTPTAPPGFNTASGFSGLGNLVATPRHVTVRRKPLTRAQKLARARKACRRKHAGRRRRCEALARRRYGVKSKKTRRPAGR